MSPRKSSQSRSFCIDSDLVETAVEQHLKAISAINDNEIITRFSYIGDDIYELYVKEENT
jgi:hypothetical protein